MSTQNILVVIDPTAAEQAALSRGVQLAEQLGCGLELLICIHETHFAGSRFLDLEERASLRDHALQHQQGYLNSLVEDLDLGNIPVRTSVVWDSPLGEGIIRAALRSEPRLVLKDTHHHSAIARTLFTSTDWQLIRDCPAPVWLVKSAAPIAPSVLAAVDPGHEHEKPASLDHVILAEASQLAFQLQGQLHVYHGYDTLRDIARAGSFSMTPTAIPVEEINARVKQEHADAFNKLLAEKSIAPDNRHLLAGRAIDILPGLAREVGAGLVVMGAVARSRLDRITIGSTAERVLDQLPCDILILKPPGFDSRVTYKAQASDFMELNSPA